MKRLKALLVAAALVVSTLGITAIPQSGTTEAKAASLYPTSDPYDPVLVDDNDVVICVDPGHDKFGTGTSGSGLQERLLTPKIAGYMKARLESYGAKVFLTRKDGNSTYMSLSTRTAYAAYVGADAFISVHLNGASPSAHGKVMFYPNKNYDKNCSDVGKKIARAINDHLTDDLGIADCGSTPEQYKNSANKSKYPDGSLADYYGVIRTAKLHHIPAVIMEPCFLTNKSDTSKYLSSDEKLRALGEAEADGVADALGLTDGSRGTLPGKTDVTSAKVLGSSNNVEVTWKAASNAEEYVIYRKTTGSYKEVGRSTQTNFTDNTASYGKTYTYTVIARNSNGRAASYEKSGVKVTTPGHTIKVNSAKDNGLNRVVIKWEKDPEATGYRIYRSSDGNNFKKLTTIKKQSLKYTDESAGANKTVYYVVKPYKKVNSVNVWGTVNRPGFKVTTDGDEAGNLTGSLSADNKSVTLNWNKFEDADAFYRIYKSTNDGDYSRITTTNTDLTYTDTELQPGTTVSYKLRLYRKTLHGGKTVWSKYSNVVTFRVPAEQTAASDGTISSAVQTKKTEVTETHAVWVSIYDYASLGLKTDSEKTFSNKAQKFMEDIKDDYDINTVYMQVRSGDNAAWESKTFPAMEYLTQKTVNRSTTAARTYTFDRLKIMTDTAHKNGIKLVAWMNPYRVSPSYFLNPASSNSINRVNTAVKEVMKYGVDGVIFDDYFYHASKGYRNTPDGKTVLKASQAAKLSKSTKNKNVNKLVKKIYSTVHSASKTATFGIAPQGNLTNDRASGADVDTWLSKEGYIDYLEPQMYFTDDWGSEGGTKMFTERVKQFTSSSLDKLGKTKNIALALYRSDTDFSTDHGWTKKSDNLASQYQILKKAGCTGYSLFSASYLYSSKCEDELGYLNEALGK